MLKSIVVHGCLPYRVIIWAGPIMQSWRISKLKRREFLSSHMVRVPSDPSKERKTIYEERNSKLEI